MEEELDEDVEAKLQRARALFGRRSTSESMQKRPRFDADAQLPEATSDQNFVDVVQEEEPQQLVATGIDFKVVAGTPFVVDGFKLKDADLPKGCVFFLTHFHSDHYGGLSATFKHPIFCSAVTGALVVEQLGVKRELIRILPLEKTVMIDGVEVTAFDANHCPGAILLLFSSKSSRVLHCGDFRWNRERMLSSSLGQIRPRDLSHLYLDTTFNDKKFDFPSQEEVISKGVKLALEFLASSKTCLLLFGSYSIGKERLFLAVAEEAKEHIYASEKKLKLLRTAGCDMRWFVSDKDKARLRVVSMGKCGFNQLLSFSHQNPHHDLVVGFSPSGWNWAKVSKRKYRESGILHTSRAFEKIVAVALPYSEHSSFCELVDCVSFFRPKHVVPTVHNTGRSKEAIAKQLIPFHPYIDLTNDKSTIIGLFSSGSRTASTPVNAEKPQTLPPRAASAPSLTQRTLNFFFGK